jgi:hypothetical protein
MAAVAEDFREGGGAASSGVSTGGVQVGIMVFMIGCWLEVMADDGLPGWLGALTPAFHSC